MIYKIFQRRMDGIKRMHKNTEIRYTTKFLNYDHLKMDVKF